MDRSQLLAEVHDFIILEAELLDASRYEDWLGLWSTDGRYWMPCDPTAQAPGFVSSIIDDDLRGLTLRVTRLREPNAHAMSPPPVGCRLIGNVAIEADAPLQVRSKLICHEFQRREVGRDDYRVFAASVRHTLLRTDQGLRIKLKRVDLVDAEGARSVMPIPI